MSDDTQTKLMYRPFSSLMSPGFWQTLTNLKLNTLKLSQEPVSIRGTYSCGQARDLPCIASFDETAFNQMKGPTNFMSCSLYGLMTCFNTAKSGFESIGLDYLKRPGQDIWSSICSGEALSNPEQSLNRFELLVHADLKKYYFTFLFAYPALVCPEMVCYHKDRSKQILDVINERALDILYKELQRSDDCRSFPRSHFIVTCSESTNQESDDCKLTVFALTQYNEARKECLESKSKLYFALNDPSGTIEYPGWPLRNYLCLIWKQFNLTNINIIRIRMGLPTEKSKIRLHHSIVMCLEMHGKQPSDDECPKVCGWEADEVGKLCPRKTDLSRLLDPKVLASEAVDLNLRLMKWRLMPTLDLDKIASSKCLLIGCGTLGCHVARGLLAWGVKNLTLIDNSQLSYSNPVRQSLYLFEDCSNSSGKPYKANVAAQRLKQIHPTVNVTPIVMDIPMPGHGVKPMLDQNNPDRIKAENAVSQLDELIEAHDVIFLMTDTRESRWLPTVIAMTKKKLLINSAIGFDTFLIQRHGMRDYNEDNLDKVESYTATSGDKVAADKLGCYFCNDIVAPGNSTLDRTLDQQCTVTRPGVSMLVGALVVELFASIMSSAKGPSTAAQSRIPNDTSTLDQDNYDGDLGIVPHSIRGDISRYHIYMPTSTCFNKCSACSTSVITGYRDGGNLFCTRVFEDPDYLESVCGLEELHEFDTTAAVAFDSDEDFTEDG